MSVDFHKTAFSVEFEVMVCIHVLTLGGISRETLLDTAKPSIRAKNFIVQSLGPKLHFVDQGI